MSVFANIIAEFNPKGINEAESSFKKFGQVVGGALATTAIVNFGKSILHAAESAATSEARIRQVATSMNLFGDNVDDVTRRLVDYANQTAKQTGIDDDQIQLTQAKLLTFKDLARTAGEVGGAFDRATQAAIDLAATGFGDAASNAVQLGKALQDPVKGITALSRAGVTFTADEKEAIKSMVEMNDTAGAQNAILAALESQVGGTAAATATDTGKMSVAFEQLQEKLGESLLPTVAGLTEAMFPLVDLFSKIPKPVKDFAMTAGLSATLGKSLSKSLQGLDVSATSANMAMGALTIAMIAYSGNAQANAEANRKATEAMSELSRATDTQLKAQLAAVVATRIFTDESMDSKAVLADIARESYGTAQRIVEQGLATEALGLTTAEANAVLQAESAAQKQVAADMEASNAVIDDQTEALDEETKAADDLEKALQKVISATLSMFNSQIGLEESTWATKDAIASFGQLVESVVDGTYEGSDAFRDYAQAENDVYKAALSQADAALKLATDQATAEGATLSAAEAAKIQATELQKVADQLNPSSPLRKQLDDYITTLSEKIPKEIKTNLAAEIKIGMAGGGFGNLTFRAAGGPVTGGNPYIVGENGPEMFIPNMSGNIVSNSELMRVASGSSISSSAGAGAGSTITVNVQGADPNAVVRALQQYVRLSGPVPVNTRAM